METVIVAPIDIVDIILISVVFTFFVVCVIRTAKKASKQ